MLICSVAIDDPCLDDWLSSIWIQGWFCVCGGWGGGGGLVLWGGGAGIVGMTLFHCSVSLVFVCSGGIDVHRGCFL